MLKTTRFDAADYLDSEERQAAYMTAALKKRCGLRARMRSVNRGAGTRHGAGCKTADLNRESLQGARCDRQSRVGTVMRVMRALGLTLAAPR